MKTPLTIISYYTNDWLYPDYSKKLTADCERLRVNYKVVNLPSRNCYKENCRLKSEFILNSLMEIKSPILWMDVDGSINRIPEYMSSEELLEYDLAGFSKPWSERSIFVATIWFNYTKNTLSFINQWQQNTNLLIDDEAFQRALWDSTLHTKILPKSDFEILRGINDSSSVGCCFSHRLSKSDLKESFKTNNKRDDR